jgi:3-oxoacyl-[acyl-carrier protein] reductase
VSSGVPAGGDLGTSGRAVAISGASSGIGQATARRFAEAGDRVFNLDLRAPDEPDPGVSWIACDVTDWESVDAALAEVEADAGAVDVAIANAGISIRHSILDTTYEDARRVLDVNLMGVLGLWRSAARHMLSNGGGVLLATASTNALAGYPLYADYNASKAGVVALTRTFALEFSPLIRAACVAPGYIMTPMQRAEYTDEMLEDVNRRIPLRRHGEAAEVAGLFFFLASDAARFVTGQSIVLDGGELAGGTASLHGLADVQPEHLQASMGE